MGGGPRLESIRQTARAKLNLTLDVLGRRADGYHELRSIFLPLSLADEVSVEPAPGLVRGAVTGPCAADLPPPQQDLAVRAARLLHAEAGLPPGVGARVSLHKRIPTAAGLGGGSMDAAAVLIALTRLWRLRQAPARLAELALTLGADVPFGLLGSPALAEGIGERLTPVPVAGPLHVVLAKPPVAKSTAAVYHALDLHADTGRPDTERALAALSAGDLEALAACLGNALQPVMFRLHPQLERLRDALIAAGAVGAGMTGAGPTLFGLARDSAHAESIAARLERAGGLWVAVATAG